MYKLPTVLTPVFLLAASCPAMSVVHTPAWTENFDEPVYRSVPYTVEHVHHHLFGETRTYTTEVRQVLDHYETRAETHPDAYTQVDDYGVTTVIGASTFNAYLPGRALQLRAGVRTTGRINSRFVAGDPNDQVIDLGPTVVVAAPIVAQPSPVYVERPVVVVAPCPPAPVIVRREEHWDFPIVIGVGIGGRPGPGPWRGPVYGPGRGPGPRRW